MNLPSPFSLTTSVQMSRFWRELQRMSTLLNWIQGRIYHWLWSQTQAKSFKKFGSWKRINLDRPTTNQPIDVYKRWTNSFVFPSKWLLMWRIFEAKKSEWQALTTSIDIDDPANIVSNRMNPKKPHPSLSRRRHDALLSQPDRERETKF